MRKKRGTNVMGQPLTKTTSRIESFIPIFHPLFVSIYHLRIFHPEGRVLGEKKLPAKLGRERGILVGSGLNKSAYTPEKPLKTVNWYPRGNRVPGSSPLFGLLLPTNWLF